MKTRTIKQVVQKKVNEWLASIEDETVRKMAEDKTIVTGGAIASMLLAEPVNDYDIYFRDRETALAIASYYVARFKPQRANGIPCALSVDETDGRVRIVVKSAGIASDAGADRPYEYFESRPEGEATEYVEEIIKTRGDVQDKEEEVEAAVLKQEDDGKPHYRPIFLSTNAITLSQKVQIVLRFFGEPDDIHANYDFVHCANYWRSWDGGELVLRQPALESLLARELRYVGSKYPVCSLIRMRKFIRRGWTINAGQILKMVLQVNELDLKDFNVLRDQLTGVDVAYFAQLVQAVHEKDPEKVNAAYLVEIIDRMY